jgi:hypothetical protein
MAHRLSDPSTLRGLAVGSLTAALALAAHGAAGAVPGSGAAAILLALLATGFGGLASALERADEPAVLVALLAAGQAVGHLMLVAAGHSHAPVPGGAMLAAHALAVVVGALLIAGAERLCRALSTVLDDRTARRTPAPVVRPIWALTRPDHPLQSRLLVAVSISHRGPPPGVC